MNDRNDLSVGYGAVAVAVAVFIVYAISLHNGFAFDDVVLIPRDPRVINGWLGDLISKPYWNDNSLGLYRPLTSLSFGLDWMISSGSDAWFHLTNLLWHMIASVLAYVLLTRFFAPRAALFGGLIFAVHPVHVEAVANIVGRSELMAAAFFFAACIAWSSDSLPRGLRLAATFLCYLLAMLAKESAVVLPAVLWVIEGKRQRRPADYIGFTLALFSFLLLRHRIIGGLAPSHFDPSIEVAHGVSGRLITALQAWPVELKVMLFPKTLLADYGPRILMPTNQFNTMATLGLMLVVLTVVGGLVALFQKRYLWALGLLWFPITILTVSNFIIPIGVLVAERTLYLPLFAICFGVTAVLSHHRITSSPHHLIIATAVIALMAVRSEQRIPDWKSTDSIMLAMVRDRPDAFRGQWHMARMARQDKRPQDALKRYDGAMKLWPYREGLAQEAAAYASDRGAKAWSRDVAFYGTMRWPKNIDFYRLLAANAVDLGDTATARTAVRKGLAVKPDDAILNDMWRAFGTPAKK